MSTVSLNISNEILQYFYTRLSYFRAKCLYCEYDTENFQNDCFWDHTLTEHTEIMAGEMSIKSMYSELVPYFDYIDERNVKCVTYEFIFPIEPPIEPFSNVTPYNETLSTHLLLYSKDDLIKYEYRTMEWKYWTEIGNYLECNICRTRENINVSPNLKLHIKILHPHILMAVQKMQDVTGL